MKIICIDNDEWPDRLIFENVPEDMGNAIVGLLNNVVGKRSIRWFRLVADDYKLFKGIYKNHEIRYSRRS